ncbi:hypothetical protein ACFLV0_05090 [Chloroflexota bacterium]
MGSSQADEEASRKAEEADKGARQTSEAFQKATNAASRASAEAMQAAETAGRLGAPNRPTTSDARNTVARGWSSKREDVYGSMTGHVSD